MRPPACSTDIRDLIHNISIASEQNSDLRTTLQQQSSALDVLQSSERATASSISDAHREKALLLSDKQFLQSELRNLELKNDEKSRENEGNISRRNALEDKVAEHIVDDSYLPCSIYSAR